jgi:hypothetical protein
MRASLPRYLADFAQGRHGNKGPEGGSDEGSDVIIRATSDAGTNLRPARSGGTGMDERSEVTSVKWGRSQYWTTSGKRPLG